THQSPAARGCYPSSSSLSLLLLLQDGAPSERWLSLAAPPDMLLVTSPGLHSSSLKQTAAVIMA
ncbi:hypothetical protein JOQ06_024839, partial [Pogonophryne albipinna]